MQYTSFSIIIKLIVAIAISQTAVAKNLKIQSQEFGREKRHSYFKEILQKSLELGGKKNYKLHTSKKNQPQSKNVVSVQKGQLDVIWTMTSKSREQTLKAIRVPLYKGMLGIRICIVAKDEIGKLSNINSLGDFIQKGFRIGQGFDWPDTQVLQANQLKVVTSKSYEKLFDMVENKDFECFARGISEPWEEINKYGKNRLAIDQSLAFFYRSPVYFFVKKENTELAGALEKGLHKSISDGSFDEIFTKYHSSFIEKAQLSNRSKIFLKNPDLSPESQEVARQSKYWLKIK